MKDIKKLLVPWNIIFLNMFQSFDVILQSMIAVILFRHS